MFGILSVCLTPQDYVHRPCKLMLHYAFFILSLPWHQVFFLRQLCTAADTFFSIIISTCSQFNENFIHPKYRVQFQRGMQQKKWSNRWVSVKVRLYSSARNAVVSSQSVHITVLFASVALERWIITVRGSITVWERTIKNTSFCLR